MATQGLSKESENRITDSLSEAAELVNSGSSPNEAIAKTASSHGVPVGHLELMVRAFNTGRSEAHRQAGSDPLEKLAEFDLADLKTVIGLVYPDSVKTASSMIKEGAVSGAYGRPPVQPKFELKPLGKLASDQGKYVTLAQDSLGKTRVISSLIEKMGRDSEKLRMDSAHSKDLMMDSITKIATYFRTFGGVPFSVAKENSVRLFGKKADSLLNILAISNKAFRKQAGTLSDVMAPVELSQAPYSLIKDCIKHAEVHLNKKAAVDHLKKVIGSALSAAFSDDLPGSNTGSVLDGLNKSAGKLWDKNKGMFSGAYNYVQSAPKDHTVSNDSNEYKFRNDQIAQDMTLKNIRASAAISDLMANDEIIGGYHPEDVAFHFNEISSIAPDTTTNTAIMRPLLRKRLVGGTSAIDPSDITQMLEIENSRGENQKLRGENAFGSDSPSKGRIKSINSRIDEHAGFEKPEDEPKDDKEDKPK
jgi:hypothetical protein